MFHSHNAWWYASVIYNWSPTIFGLTEGSTISIHAGGQTLQTPGKYPSDRVPTKWEKKSSFPGFFRALRAWTYFSIGYHKQKVTWRLPIVRSILADIYLAGSLLPESLLILFTQSTAVLHKYLNDELKILLFVNIFPRLHRIPWEFPEFSMFREIPEYSRFSRFVATLPYFCVFSVSFSSFTTTFTN